MSEQLIIAGFHRSGTSFLCQLLQKAGLFLGYELLGANPSNPYGHMEDLEIMKLHETILADNGTSWQAVRKFAPVISDARADEIHGIIARRNEDHSLWGFKDPRVCLFLPVWKHFLPRAKVLIVYRHFKDSTNSLARRQAHEYFERRARWADVSSVLEEPDLALKMWLVYNEALLTFARAYPEDTLAVSLDMVRGDFPVVETINDRWGLSLERTTAASLFDPSVTASGYDLQPISDVRLIPRTEKTWSELQTLSGLNRVWKAGR